MNSPKKLFENPGSETRLQAVGRGNQLTLQAACVAVCLILSLFTAKAATLFRDNFETQTVGIAPVTAPVGTYVAPNDPGIVTNSTPPGAHGGTKYLQMMRGATNVPFNIVRGRFPVNVAVNGTVHFEAWMWLDSPGIAQFGLDATSDGFASTITLFSSTTEIQINGVGSGLTMVPGQWSHYELDYTVGSTNVTLTVDGVATVGVIPARNIVQGIWIYTGSPNTILYVDDVLATANPPSSSLIFLDGYETTLYNVGKIFGPPPIGSYIGGASKPDVLKTNVPGPAVSGSTNYIKGERNAIRNDNLRGRFTPIATNAGAVVHFEVWEQAVEPGPGGISCQIILETADRSLGSASGDAFTFTLWTSPDYSVKIYNTVDGVTGHKDTGLHYTPGVWQKFEIDYTIGASNCTLTLGGVSTNVIVVLGAYPGYANINGCWLYQADNGATNYYDEAKIEVRTPTGTNVVFYDGYETYPFGPFPFPPSIGTYLPLTPPLFSGLVTNAVPPGAYAGTNFLRMLRGSGNPPSPYQALSGTFDPAVNKLGDAVHLECQILMGSGRGQFGFNTATTQFSNAIVTLWNDGRVSVYNGVTNVFPSLAYTQGVWQKFALDYTNGASTLKLTVNSASAVLSVPPITTVAGLWFSSDDTGTVMNLDEVSAALTSAPRLNIIQQGNQVTLSWFTMPGFFLQENTNRLNAATWTNVPGGDDSPVTVPIGGVPKYFRLRN